RGRRALVGRRIRLGDMSGWWRVALVRWRIRGAGLVRGHHHRLLYRKSRSSNPLVGVGEPGRELVLDALHLLLELDEPFPRRTLGGLVAAPRGVAERLQRRPAFRGDRIEPRLRAPAGQRRLESRPP